jgi:hypothetical protein
MRIEELILEGFKSYPVRTTINGWDSSFNVSQENGLPCFLTRRVAADADHVFSRLSSRPGYHRAQRIRYEAALFASEAYTLTSLFIADHALLRWSFALSSPGKSNILDAICFVLGITNMTSVRALLLQAAVNLSLIPFAPGFLPRSPQVRASNLLDLIYKRGQAGVTKASVTIVFDNSERATSPVGFEDKRQITVTRQVRLSLFPFSLVDRSIADMNVSPYMHQIAVGGLTKYLLNGHKTTLQVLQNLFQSVQLNINNPNFLIMQGKITKVLNMKPQEILGMVEEAAGTRMFEERKDKAVKTMAKKDKKVAEMESVSVFLLFHRFRGAELTVPFFVLRGSAPH